MKLKFVTSNKGKIASLQNFFIAAGRADIEVEPVCLNIVEPQLDSVQEVSKYKALKAFEMLKEPLLVEDGGLSIPALNGFPGVYSKYCIDTLKSDGFLKLMVGEENRSAKFLSYTTFVDKNGGVYQFERKGGDFEIASEKKEIESPFAWSDIWKIAYIREFGKLLCELTREELDEYMDKSQVVGSLQNFAEWFLKKH